MNLRTILYFLLLFLFTDISKPLAQNRNDSLKLIWENETAMDSSRFNALKKYYDINNQTNPDSTLASLDYYYKLAKEKNAIEHLFKASNWKGNVNRLKGNYDIAMSFYDEAENLAIQLNDSILQAVIFGNKGNVFIYRNDYQLATQFFSDALKIFQAKGEMEYECLMLTSLGSVFGIIQNYELALEYYSRALSILDERGFEDKQTAIIYMNTGWVNFKKGEYENAMDYYEKGLKILEIKNDMFLIATCYSSLALIHHKLNKLEEANFYAKKNLELNKKLDIKRGIIDAEIIIAEIAFETDVKEATKKGEAILAHLPSKIDKEIKKDLYELLYKCYKKQNKLDLSLKMHEFYTIYNDSIQLERNKFAVAREVIKNYFETKIYENKLESEREKAQLRITQLKSKFIIISISVLLIALISFISMSIAKRNAKRRNVLLKEIKELKSKYDTKYLTYSNKFELKREIIEAAIKRTLNETDWKVLNILLEDPVITNKKIAEKAFMSIDGIGSSLRRMYEYFDINESKYKKISLLLEAIKISNFQTSVE